MAHDPEESLPRAGAALIVGSSAQLFHVRFEQGEGTSGGIATSCSLSEVLAVRVATVGKVEHTLVVVEVGKQVAVHLVGTRYQHTHKEEQ